MAETALTIWRPARNRIYCMDAFLFLRSLPTNSVNCVVTSPPYFGLRDYGTAAWSGGDPSCSHRVGNQVQDSKAPGAISSGVRPGVDASRCKICGAIRIDQQIGLEPTPDQFVATMVTLFREARRVLREDGVLWLNLGDSYSGYKGENYGVRPESSNLQSKSKIPRAHNIGTPHNSVPAKNLLGIPWRVALALQADGWILRSDVIWSKPNPMPESVTDRPTKAHEYCFLLTKSGRYWWDAEAVREPNAGIMPYGDKRNFKMNEAGAQGRHGKTSLFAGGSKEDYIAKYYINGRNLRTVWEVATEPTPFAHFATFPRKLIEPMIKAGCPKGGLVLDPFMGSGTTGLVARSLGRDYVGCDLNPEYVKLAQSRLELPLLDLVEQPELVGV